MGVLSKGSTPSLFKRNKMKNTIVMVAVVATLLLTWALVGLVGSYLCECTLRESLVGNGTLGFMIIVGWLPASIVGMDLSGIND